MKEKIETLLSRYYAGDTTLAEEKELRELLLKVGGFEGEKQFFLGLEVIKAMEPAARAQPRVGRTIPLWQKVAAVVAMCGGLSWLLIDHQIKREEAMAYAQVMEAFDLIQQNMKKGTASLQAIQEMKHLNKANEIFNINNKEEQ
jgi:hypothetical protein